jgi:hypothetical protein
MLPTLELILLEVKKDYIFLFLQIYPTTFILAQNPSWLLQHYLHSRHLHRSNGSQPQWMAD